MVVGAFARASATPAAKSGAAYVSLLNQGADADRLLAVATPAAASAELHRSVMTGDVMEMEAVEAVDLEPGVTVAMDPGGLHVMLMGLAAPLREGGSIEMLLTFERAGKVTVHVPVKGVAAGHGSGG